MATLVQDSEQVKACNRVNELLEEVKVLNARLLSDKTYIISVGRKQTITMDMAFKEKIDAIVKAQRLKMVKEINNLSNKFRIALSDEDQDVISEKAIKAKAVPAEEAVEMGGETEGEAQESLFE